MGARSIFMEVGSIDKKKVLSAFKKRVKSDVYEYGHNEYSGTFGTFSGLNFKMNQEFSSAEEAKEFILKLSDKWGDAIAVVVNTGQEVYTLIGGWAAE